MCKRDVNAGFIALAVIATAAMTSRIAEAQDEVWERPMFGVGAVVGDPTSVSVKSMLDSHHALQLAIGWAVLPPFDSRLNLNVDYLYHLIAVRPWNYRVGVLSPYVGIGGELRAWNPAAALVLGVRAPLGVSFLFRVLPIELFAEAAPGIYFVPQTEGFVEVGVGGRFYF